MEQVCGVYAITAPQGATYVGSSVDCWKRWNEHRLAIRSGKSYYCKHFAGPLNDNALRFQILETCQRVDRFNRERYWMTQYPNRVNIQRDVITVVAEIEEASRLRRSRLGKPHTEQTRKKMSLSRSGGARMTAENRAKLYSPETRKKISAAHVGKTLTHEHKEKIRRALVGRFFSEETRIKISMAKMGHPSTVGHDQFGRFKKKGE